jgi:proteasome lid subunit RPN8/RPN11
MDYRELANVNLDRKSAPGAMYDFRVFIAEEAFDRICSNPETTNEVGGMLVGDVLRDDNGPYIQVETVIEALHAKERGAELTLTHETWNDIHGKMDSLYADKKIIGWYHTHPNFGIFLSERDLFIQQSFFNLPWQIALVYDPVRREHGVYAWRDSKPWRVRQYWIGENEHTWDSPREAAKGSEQRAIPPGAKKPEEGGPKQSQEPPRPPSLLDDLPGGGWLLPIAGAVALFALFWLGMRYFPMGASPQGQDDAVRAAIASLNADLLAVVRASLGDESSWRSFDDGLNQLNQAVKDARPLQQNNPAFQPVVQSMEGARETLDRARKDRRLAYEMLRRIEQVSGRAPDNRGEINVRLMVQEELKKQRQALGGIYAELAQEAMRIKNPDRARQLLTSAVNADPDRKSDYEQQLKSFDPKSVFQSDASGKFSIHSSEPTPQPSPSGKPAEPGKKTDDGKKETKAI